MHLQNVSSSYRFRKQQKAKEKYQADGNLKLPETILKLVKKGVFRYKNSLYFTEYSMKEIAGKQKDCGRYVKYVTSSSAVN